MTGRRDVQRKRKIARRAKRNLQYIENAWDDIFTPYDKWMDRILFEELPFDDVRRICATTFQWPSKNEKPTR